MLLHISPIQEYDVVGADPSWIFKGRVNRVCAKSPGSFLCVEGERVAMWDCEMTAGPVGQGTVSST